MREVLREEKWSKGIDLERGEGFDVIDLGGRSLGMKDAGDAECEAKVAG